MSDWEKAKQEYNLGGPPYYKDRDRHLRLVEAGDKEIERLEKDLADCDPQWQHAVSENIKMEQEIERLEAALRRIRDHDYPDAAAASYWPWKIAKDALQE